MKKLKDLIDLVDENSKPIVKDLVENAIHWQARVKKFEKQMEKLENAEDINADNRLIFYSCLRILKESQGQYNNTIIILQRYLKDLQPPEVEDEFEKFLKDFNKK